MGLKKSIKHYVVNQARWVNGGELERFAEELGYKASNASRRARELAEDGIFERKIEKRTVWYRVKQKQEQKVLFEFPTQFLPI